MVALLPLLPGYANHIPIISFVVIDMCMRRAIENVHVLLFYQIKLYYRHTILYLGTLTITHISNCLFLTKLQPLRAYFPFQTLCQPRYFYLLFPRRTLIQLLVMSENLYDNGVGYTNSPATERAII